MNISVSDVFAIQQWWDYVLYGLIFAQIILLVLLFSGSLRDVIFIGITLMAAFADKAYLFGYVEGGAKTLNGAIVYHTTESFMTYASRIAMFALPIIIVTQTSIKRARPMAFIVAVYAAIYAFGRWYDQQYSAGRNDLHRTSELDEYGVHLAQAGVVFLLLGEFKLRALIKRLCGQAKHELLVERETIEQLP